MNTEPNGSKYLARSIISLLGLLAMAGGAAAQQCDYQQDGWEEICRTGTIEWGTNCEIGPGNSSSSGCDSYTQPETCWYEPTYSCVTQEDDPSGLGGSDGGSDTGEVAQNVVEFEVNCDDATSVATVTDRPVVITNGQKILNEVDFVVGGDNPIPLVRLYNSFSGRPGVFGPKWHALFEYSLELIYTDGYCGAAFSHSTTCAFSGEPNNIVLVRRGGGPVSLSKNASGDWVDTKSEFLLRPITGGGWSLITKDGATEKYNANLQATEVLGPTGTGWRYTYNTAGTLTRMTHTSGRYVDLSWLAGKITALIPSGGSGYTYQYASTGVLGGVTYPGGIGTRTYHYEDWNFQFAVTGISVNNIRNTRYSYYADGRARESGLETGADKSTFTYGEGYTDVTNATGATTRYTIGDVAGSKRITRVDRAATSACASGTVTSEYGADEYLDFEVDAAGNKTEYTYDAIGTLLTKTTGIAPGNVRTAQKITDFVWDAAGMILQGKREYGASRAQYLRETAYDYYPMDDALGRATLVRQVTIHDRTSTAVPQASRTVTFDYQFHANRQVSQVSVDGPVPGTGDLTRYAYSAYGDLTSITNSQGHVTSFSNFTSTGLPGRQTDANGLVTDLTYDAKGRVTKVTINAPDGPRITSFTYDAFDQVTSVTDAAGRKRTYRYDQARRLTSITADALYPLGLPEHPSTDTIAYSYNLLNKVTSRKVSQEYFQYKRKFVNGEPVDSYIAASEVYTQQNWTFDPAGHTQALVGNAGQSQTLAYNGNEDLVSSTDANGRATTSVYDSHRRILEIQVPGGGVVKYHYDAYGRLDKLTDANGKSSLYSYNGFDEVLTAWTPAGGLMKFQYDAAGRRTKVSRPDGSYVTSTYDALGRVTRRDAVPASSQGAPPQSIIITYDTCTHGKGRTCRVDDVSGSTTYAYRLGGELASQVSIIDSVTYSMAYGYDGIGRLSTTTYGNGVILRNSYNANSDVTRVEAYIGGAWKIVVDGATYQSFGPLTGFAYGNEISRTHSFDKDGRLTAIKSGTTGPQELLYSYNTNDQVTGITNSRYPTLSQTFTYSDFGELLSANTAGAAGNQAFGYDLNGNRTLHTWPSGSRTYSYSASTDRLGSIGGTGARTYVYDNNGNPQTITEAGASLSHRYDGFGNAWWLSRNLAQTTVATNGSGTQTLPAGTWVYGFNGFGQRVTKYDSAVAGKRRYLHDAQGRLVAESLAGSGQIDSIYVWFDGAVVGLIRGGQLYFVHDDLLGRPEMLTNSAKAVVWRAENYAFDRRVVLDTVGSFNLGFPGQYYDAETAQWHNVHRIYDAQTGRYLQSDPMGMQAGLNMYAYVGNDPLRAIDPLGLLRRLTECESSTLAPYFPNLNLEKIRIKEGIPWIVRKFGAEGADAWTLGNWIFMTAGVDIPDTIDGIALIGHELVHTVQYGEEGLFGMAYRYPESYNQNLESGMSEDDAYRNNRFEIPAYDMGAKIENELRYRRSGNPCECFQ